MLGHMRSIRYIVLLLFLTSVSLAQSIDFLAKRVTLDVINKPIEEILKSLETDQVAFTYSPEVFDVKKRVSLNVRNRPIRTVLDLLFQGQDMEYQAMSNQVILRKKRVPVDTTDTTGAVTKTLKESSTSKRKLIRKVPSKPGRVEPPVSVVDSTGHQSKASTGKSVGQSEEMTIAMVQEAPKVYRSLNMAIPRSYSPVAYLYNFKTTKPTYTPLYRPVYSADLPAPKPIKQKKVRVKKPRPEFEKKLRFSATSFTGYTEIDGDAAILMGGRLTYYIKPSFGIGLAGNAFQTSRRLDEVLNGNFRPAGGYGGLLLEYSLMPWKRVHLNFPLVIGGGGILYSERDPQTVLPTIETSMALFVVEQSLEVEVNLLKFLKVGVGASYRYASNTGLNYNNGGERIISNQALTGLSFGITVKGGIF